MTLTVDNAYLLDLLGDNFLQIQLPTIIYKGQQ